MASSIELSNLNQNILRSFGFELLLKRKQFLVETLEEDIKG